MFVQSVEWFLVKEVNYVVTDRPNWTPGSGGSVSGSTPKCGVVTPLGGLCSNESPATLESPGDGPRGGARRSNAMLERARLQPQQCTVDPLENATRWSIPIWPLDKVLKWLDKICEKFLKPSSSSSSSSSATVLKNPYIKLEHINSIKYRPLYKELSVWPTVNINFESGGCPFSPPKVLEKRSTQRAAKNNKDASRRIQPGKATAETPRMTKCRVRAHRAHEAAVALQNSGYCEICQQTYVDQRAHVESERHIQFVNNNSNFVSLDQLIHQGPDMDTFLKLNGVNEISDCESEVSGNCRRSLRSVVKLHSLTLDTNAPVKASSGGNKTPEEGSKMLLQQKESLEVRHVQCNGIWSHCYDTRHGGMKSPISGNIARRMQWDIQIGGGGGRPQRMRRASASYCTPSLQQQLSPTGSDSGHHLRSRGQIWLPSNLLGTTAEDEAFPSRTRLADPQPARTSRDIPVTREPEVKSSPCRNQAIRRKRLSVEEKLIEDNKAYYKIELKNSKLRSSGYYPSQRDLEPPIKQEVKEEKVECNGDQSHKVEEPAPTKFLRVRKSELTLLSDEAESFMFGEPTRKESSTESSEEEEEDCKSKINKNSRKENSNEELNVKKSSENSKKDCGVLQCDDSSMETCSLASSCDTNTVVQKKRKRRTHAEAFIHDNLDYYKFEIPGSRLRFQGSILPPTLPSPGRTTNNSKGSKATCNGAHSKVVSCSNEAPTEKEKIVQSQEETKERPERETESKGDKKQEKDDDKKKEEKDESNVKECVENNLTPTTEKLHFSFEVVPQSEPWYQTYTRQDEGEEFYAYAHMSDACYWKPFLLPYEMPMPETSSVAGSAICPGSSGFVRKRRNRFAHLLDKKPRKSPRCHASTLAILSSLMHHRRRKEPDKPKEENSKSEHLLVIRQRMKVQVGMFQIMILPEIAPAPVPNSDFKSESDADLHEIARNIDKMFGSDGEEVSGSENDNSGDEVKQETPVSSHRGRKTGRKNKKGKPKKVELESSKQDDMLEIDPAAVKELSLEPPPMMVGSSTELRCRGGPKMDVVL
ncbi:hypothetical protein L9F63_014846 [Diploptera punctata]|uniref:DBF4-type domain-containing protein n=1 Tax=Diploptera punctata TaxID=6984 RepID=A0AAD8EL72_DIPPU|nr:hypothetical protein L9F63_014846 [Diploptera punctata]